MTKTLRQAEWERFAERHAARTVPARGHCWRLFDTGERAGDAVVLLPGALGRGETAFSYVLALEAAGLRVLSLDYPATARTLADLADGLPALLTARGVARAHAVGGSFGGLVGQAFADRHPERVLSLALTDTSAPDLARAPLMRLLGALIGALPAGATRAVVRRGIRAYLAGVPAPERGLWEAHFAERLSALTRPEIASRARVWAEFDAAGGKPALWSGRVLVVTARDDRMLSPGAQERRLRARYPHAVFRTVESGGHAASIAHPEEYIRHLTGFFADDD